MIFRRKNKEFNVINFGNGCWGNDIVYDKNITKNMFFATVRTITKDKMLSKSEMKYLKDNNLINIKRK